MGRRDARVPLCLMAVLWRGCASKHLADNLPSVPSARAPRQAYGRRT